MSPENYDFLKKIVEENIIENKIAISTRQGEDYTSRYGTWKRLKKIIQYFEEELNKKEGPFEVLDIGCSYGYCIFLLNSLTDSGKKVNFRGIDLSTKYIYLAQEIKKLIGLNNITFRTGRAEKIELPEASFDIIICSEVIEHLPATDECLHEIMRLLKPGGIAIISTPNKTNTVKKFAAMFRFLFSRKGEKVNFSEKGKESAPYEKGLTSAQEHISVKGLKEWIKIFQTQGFTIEKIRRGGIFVWGMKYNAHPVLFAFSLVIDQIFDFLPFMLNFSETILFKLRKA